MITPIKSVASSASSTADQRRDKEQATPTPSSVSAAPAAQDEPLRLVVEPVAGSANGYTYKLFDRATGALLIELPRETATKMGQSPDYSAGQVFDAKA